MHISVCICTYNRPELLQHLLNSLRDQVTWKLFTYSIVVSDNDSKRSAEKITRDCATSSGIPTVYCVQPQQSIALARNEAVAKACGDLIAFIDDDEVPGQDWLLTLYLALEQYGVDGVLGPVKPLFEENTPKWVVAGRFYDRPSYPSGHVITAKEGRTGNVLLDRRLFKAGMQAFRPQFATGEDQDFFRRMIAAGHVFVWCNEAIAYEAVPPVRWRRRFMLRRALLRGATAVLHPTFGPRDVVKSVVAVPVYLLLLPCALAFGQHKFMTVLTKLFDHLGKLLALIGIKPVRAQYITG